LRPSGQLPSEATTVDEELEYSGVSVVVETNALEVAGTLVVVETNALEVVGTSVVVETNALEVLLLTTSASVVSEVVQNPVLEVVETTWEVVATGVVCTSALAYPTSSSNK
jgi:hypothetical protein